MATLPINHASDGTSVTNLETLSLVWLDARINQGENLLVQQALRSLINYIKIFDNIGACRAYLKSLKHHEYSVLIVSGELGQELVPLIEKWNTVNAIYVFCMDLEKHAEWAQKYKKVSVKPCTQLSDYDSVSRSRALLL